MLELCRQGFVPRHGGPVVCKHFYLRAPKVDHRFNCKDHALPQFRAGSSSAEVQDVGGVMKDLTDAVAAKVADHRAAFGMCVGLDCVTDITQSRTRPHRPDPLHHRLMRDLDEAFSRALRLSHHIHPT